MTSQTLQRRIFYGYPRRDLPDDLAPDDSWPEFVDVIVTERPQEEHRGSDFVYRTKYFKWTQEGLVELGGPMTAAAPDD